MPATPDGEARAGLTWGPSVFFEDKLDRKARGEDPNMQEYEFDVANDDLHTLPDEAIIE